MTVRDNVAAFSEIGFAPHVAGLPAASISELSPEDLVIPAGFTRRLGA